MKWTVELAWVVANMNGKSASHEMFRIVVACCIHTICREHKHRVFQAKQRSQEVLMRLIIQEAAFSANMKPKLARRLRELNFNPQLQCVQDRKRWLIWIAETWDCVQVIRVHSICTYFSTLVINSLVTPKRSQEMLKHPLVVWRRRRRGGGKQG